MKYIIGKFHIEIPEKVLLDDLKKAAERLGKNYITYKEYLREGEYGGSTIIHRFERWNKALAKAGLDVKFLRKIPADELMLNMKKVWDKLGRQPRWMEMVKPLSPYGRTAYTNHYGTWQNALEAFGYYIYGKKYKADMAVYGKKHLKLQKRKIIKKFNRQICKGMRLKILTRDHFRCRACGASPATNPKVTLHIDHITPCSKGGETTMKNLWTLCSDCNLGKGQSLLRIRPRSGSHCEI